MSVFGPLCAVPASFLWHFFPCDALFDRQWVGTVLQGRITMALLEGDELEKALLGFVKAQDQSVDPASVSLHPAGHALLQHGIGEGGSGSGGLPEDMFLRQPRPQVAASDASFAKGIGGSKADHIAEKLMYRPSSLPQRAAPSTPKTSDASDW